MQSPRNVLPATVSLVEYDTCPNPDHAAALFDRRDCLLPYLDSRRRWLTRSFEGDKPCLRASHYVGVLPFACNGVAHSLLIAPKGCRGSERQQRLGLLRFLELLALGDGETLLDEDLGGLQGPVGPHIYLLFLARHYARVLQDLCKRDFRSYYRAEEGELRGRIRGTLHFAGYARGALRGKGHILPCRWEEFTVDNWDNRILWGAALRLQRVAGFLDREAGANVSGLFRPLLPWFSAVADVPITRATLRKSLLGRTSRHYRHALRWAELLLAGSDLPTAEGGVPPLILDANEAFERFAEVVVRASIRRHPCLHASFQERLPFLQGDQTQRRQPDIIVRGGGRDRAVGDTKYKEVLERIAGESLPNRTEVAGAFIQPNDWNQLYVYMRLTGASAGFFVVPFWSEGGPTCDLLDGFEYVTPPCDGAVRVAIVGLNLLCPLTGVKRDAGLKLGRWLGGEPG